MGGEIAIELVGVVSEIEWMGFGVSGSTNKTFMLGADPTVVDMYNGTFRARDFYLINRSQCSGGKGVCPDAGIGKKDDVKPGSVFGQRDQGVTTVRYIRPLQPTDIDDSLPSDSRIDRIISAAPGVSTFIVWAIGPVSPDTGLPQFHTVYPRGQDFKVEFGRAVVNNCPPLLTAIVPIPKEVFEIPVIRDTTKIVARIGPSGGDRVRIASCTAVNRHFCIWTNDLLVVCWLTQGYAGITKTISWGIAWYLNDFLIPVVEMRRGTKYTFMISGGNTPQSNSEFHPMYLSTSPSGGFAQMSPTERKQQTILAGINVKEVDANGGITRFEGTLQAPICQYETTDATFALPSTGVNFQSYFNTLDRTCSNNSSITNAAAVLEFTPTKETPDLIYYQCVTHRNLGWKIMVLDAVKNTTCRECKGFLFAGQIMYKKTLFGGCRETCASKLLGFWHRLLGYKCGSCPEPP
jgi:DOMON domain